MLSRRLDFGIESISRWRVGDQEHLPAEGKSAPRFEPNARELEKILRRPTLDERLTSLLQPIRIDPDLLEPGILAETRQETRLLLEAAAVQVSGQDRIALEAARTLIAEEMTLDEEVQSALAALLRG
ncbi:hypothetical protein PDO_4839 [Rhizobium sp. PDO1-076]|uniref:type III secretion apparatus assembly protein SctX n=1 Tax=Rhizobium sp. PDO1-076 TaxID=1125979 RepID=UPI00024E3246|nr:hypothetical protein [Rhizobium sp. PDO1-076]EHS52217.1 hypothetical protein PDO_4839 [Rhizobium sp. PDO1-076]